MTNPENPGILFDNPRPQCKIECRAGMTARDHQPPTRETAIMTVFKASEEKNIRIVPNDPVVTIELPLSVVRELTAVHGVLCHADIVKLLNCSDFGGDADSAARASSAFYDVCSDYLDPDGWRFSE